MLTAFSQLSDIFDSTPLSRYLHDGQGWIGESGPSFLESYENFGYGDDPPKDAIWQPEPPECIFNEVYTSDDDDDCSSIASEDEDQFEDLEDLEDLDPVLWDNLPPEIILLVQDHLIDQAAQDGPSKHLASKLSLVSWSWCLRLRPRLFRSLHLASTSDTTFLGTLLSRPSSTWLAPHILALTAPDPSERTFRTLARLPALRHLQITSPAPHLFTRSPASKQALACLHSLELHACTFPALSALLRTLADAPNLHSLALVNVRWTAAPGARTRRPPRLPRPAHVAAEGCTDNAALAGWLFGGALEDGPRALPRGAGAAAVPCYCSQAACGARALRGIAARELVFDGLEEDAA
ncbi:hypothetical protein PsYK624_099420 [Phanerochaete sordida]|uniref:Uncharacterized protein n=1 Tax=Phanerochaete sordida TaxID=48140 RepID=A0A9P3GFE9_9APHY|nr:hypothetical protein PsYK624_099420 [Phanerochaete sordida]